MILSFHFFRILHNGWIYFRKCGECCIKQNKIIARSEIIISHCKYFGDLFNSWNIKITHFRLKCYSLKVWIGINITVKMNKINKMILILLISNFGTCLSLRISSFCRSWIEAYRIMSNSEPAKITLSDLDWRKLVCLFSIFF